MRSILCTSRGRCEQVNTTKPLDSMSEALTLSNDRKSLYVSSDPPPHSFKHSETCNRSKDPIELITKRLVYSDDNIRTPTARIVSEKFAKGSNIVDKTVPDDGRIEKEGRDHSRYIKAAAWETYPITKLKSDLERLCEDKVATRSKSNEKTMQTNILRDCSCSPTSDKTRNKVENDQLEHVCSCKQYDKKYKAPLECEKSIFNNGEGNNHTVFNVERKIKFNTNYDSMGYTKLNTSEDPKYENFKGNTSIRFLTSTPKSTVSKGLWTENVPNYCTNVDCNSTNYSTINFRSLDGLSTKVDHRIGPENDLRNVSKDTTRIANFSTNKNCDLTDCYLSGQDTKCVNTTVSCKSFGTVTDSFPVTEKNFYYSKFQQEPKGTASTAMDALEGMLLGIKNYHDKSRMNYSMQEYQHCDVKCRNIDCAVATDVNHTTIECMKPECIRMLEEIKECTKTLEEQLTIMNKNIKVKKSKQRKDIVTQEPEKENVFVQEPSLNEFRFVKSKQDLETKLKNNVDSRKGKLVDKSFQENDGKSRRSKNMRRELKKETFLQSGKRITKLEEPKCCDERESVHNFKRETLLQNDKMIKERDECKCCRESNCKCSNEQERIHNFNITMLEKPNYYEQNNSKYSSEREGIHNSKKQLQKSENKSSSLKTNIGNYTFSFTHLKPPTASIGDDRDLSEKICLCPFPDQTSIFSNRNLLTRHEKRTRLGECTISFGNVNQNRSNYPDKTLAMLFLTKGVQNSYLKSRYKRMEFKNFKPKCSINETNNKNSEKSKRKRSQVPSVFRQLKPVQCKIERSESTGNNENIRCCIRNQRSCKMSNLLTTVCTQSSNLYITTATSVSRVSFVNNSDDYDKESIPDRSGACILS